MAAELKTDAWHRYMLYRSSERYMTFEPEEKRKEAVEAGKKFTASAYADVWAKDADLVKRVRAFLGENFHWHDRLVKDGTDLHVVQTLMDMVRGGSVVVIPEKPIFGGGIAWPPKKPASSSFWGVENYDPPRYASVQGTVSGADRGTAGERNAVVRNRGDERQHQPEVHARGGSDRSSRYAAHVRPRRLDQQIWSAGPVDLGARG